MKQLEDLIQSYIGHDAVLGLAVAILQGGEIVYTGGFGRTSVEDSGVPITPHTLFAYGSISKNICAALIMRLVEQGLLNLNTPIVTYLPELQFSRSDYGRGVTLRHLLSHTSGLPMGGKNWGPRDPDSLRQFVYEQIPRYTFLSQPGTVHLYSNTVICITGHVAEAVTGKFYDELVQEYVFDPLEMTHTTYDPVVAMTYPMALPHKTDEAGKPQVIHRIAYNVSGNPSGFAKGSVADLAQLAQMYLNNGRFGDQQFLTASSVAEMQKLHASRYIEGHAHPLAQVNKGYGLGFNVGDYKGRPAARHGGMSQSYNCFFDLFPNDQAGVVLLTNYSHDEPLLKLVAALYDHALDLPHEGIVYLDKPAALSPTFSTEQLQHYMGPYVSVESGDLAVFSVDEGLILENQGQTRPLVQFGNQQFYAEVSERYRMMVTFISDAAGNITHVMINGNPYFPLEIDAEFRPEPDLWQAFVGVYKDPTNRSLDDIFTVRLEDDTLYIKEGAYEVASQAISHNCFLSELGLIEFEDSEQEGIKLLVWGKATRFYPLNIEAFQQNRRIQYLVEIPTVR